MSSAIATTSASSARSGAGPDAGQIETAATKTSDWTTSPAARLHAATSAARQAAGEEPRHAEAHGARQQHASENFSGRGKERHRREGERVPCGIAVAPGAFAASIRYAATKSASPARRESTTRRGASR